MSKLIREKSGRQGAKQTFVFVLVAMMLASFFMVITSVPVATSPDIVFSAVTTESSSSPRSSATFSHTVPEGNDRLLLVFVALRGNRSVSTCTYGGKEMMLAIHKGSGSSSGCTMEIWYMVNPPTGTNNVVVTYDGSEDPSATAAISYTGVDQRDPIGATAGATATSGKNVTVDITTTTANSLIVGGATGHGGDTYPYTPGEGTTERWNLRTGTSTYSDAGFTGGEEAAPTVGIYTFNFTANASDDWAIAAVEVKPASVGPSIEVSPSPSSVVGTTTSPYASRLPSERKLFRAKGRYWVFYGAEEDDDAQKPKIVYRTSIDGSSWSDPTIIRDGYWNETYGNHGGAGFSVWLDGDEIHYSYGQYSLLYYRKGTLNDGGTITWAAAEQTVPIATRASHSGICVDSDGYPFIIYYCKYGYIPKVTKSSTKNGTWTEEFTHDLTTSDTYAWNLTIVPLAGNKVYVFWAVTGGIIKGKLYDSGWGSEETVSSSSLGGFSDSFSAVAIDNDVHLVFLTTSPHKVQYVKRTWKSGWGSETTLQSGMPQYSAPVLSFSSTNNDLYCFWQSAPEYDHIYYRRYHDGSWRSVVDWIDETEVGFPRDDEIMCSYQDYGNEICVIYETKTSSPYDLKFCSLVLPPTSPMLCLPTDGTYTNDSTPYFEWTNGESATSHRLLVDDDPDFSSPIENNILLVGTVGPSTVATTTYQYAIRTPLMKKTFYAKGLWWVFYSDEDNNICYKTSGNGSDWSEKVTLRPGLGPHFSLFYDGTYLHYCVVIWRAGENLYYRRGEPNADGTISWHTEEQLVLSPPSKYIYYGDPTIATDSEGYPFVFVMKWDDLNSIS